jgi:tetratricopeptide (TPR) repeat protein
VSARELLDRGAARVQRDSTLEPGQRAEIDATLGRIYYQLALYEQAKGLQEGASRLLAADPSHTLLAARTDAERAETLAALGDVPAAKTLADDAIRRLEAAPDASVADRVNAWRIRARTAVDAREFVDAARFIDKALAHVDDPVIGDDLRLLVMMSAGNASWGE